MIEITRFAPSPTGFLHVGHAYSALFAYQRGERFVLRIEDIDTERCAPEYEAAIFEDLAWLGLNWEEPVLRQSQNMPAYQAALRKLESMGVLYPCTCTRKDIDDAASAPHGPEGQIYPGTCRHKNLADLKKSDQPYALRLNIDKALPYLPAELSFTDLGKGTIKVDPYLLGDVVLARKFIQTSYHLSVCVDDDAQNITTVTRSEDLLYATHIHRVLQSLLGLKEPRYAHHKIIYDENGKRLSKRDKSITLRSLRAEGMTAKELKEKLRG